MNEGCLCESTRRPASGLKSPGGLGPSLSNANDGLAKLAELVHPLNTISPSHYAGT